MKCCSNFTCDSHVVFSCGFFVTAIFREAEGRGGQGKGGMTLKQRPAK